MAIMWLVAIIPGLDIIAYLEQSWVLYLGLFFLSVGSAMVIPRLTGLFSILSPSDLQGHSLGIFRSLGSLGRVIGPIAASLMYWKMGSSLPYLAGAAFIILPILVLFTTERKQSL